MSYPPKLWRYPKTLLEGLAFIFGLIVFWILIFPLWIIVSRDMFIYKNAQAMFYNPWVIWEEYNEGW